MVIVTWYKRALVVIALLVVTGICYFPGLSGPFLLDDFTNLVRLEYLNGGLSGILLAIFDNTGDLLNRPLSYASFLINSSHWPSNPYAFKVVNLCLHLLVGAFVSAFLFALPLRDSRHQNVFCYFVVGLWLLSPLSVSTVLYVVQRMTILAMLFSMASIYCYLRFRIPLSVNRSIWWLLGGGLSVCAAILSKENGILVIPIIVVLEIYLRGIREVPRAPYWLNMGLAFGCILFCIVFSYFVIKSYALYEWRTYSLIDRLMSQGRILFEYAYLAYIPDVEKMSLYHDGFQWNIANSKLGWGAFWVLHLVVVGLLIKNWRRYSLMCFGVAWFYIGHMIESTFIPLEFMFEHRNYFPSLGLFIVAGAVAKSLYSKFELDSDWVKTVLFTAPVLVCSVALTYRAGLWGDEYSMSSKWAYYKHDSERAQYHFVGVLENSGMLEMAHQNMAAAARKYDRLGFYFRAWRMQCYVATDTAAAVKFPSNERIRAMEHSSEVALEFEVLLREWGKGECIPERIKNNRDIIDFIEAVLGMEYLDSKLHYKAGMLQNAGDFYKEQGWYTEAADVHMRLFSVQPTVDTALRNADLALKYGAYVYAEDYIVKARDINAALPWLAADRSAQINHLDEALKKKLEAVDDIDRGS